MLAAERTGKWSEGWRWRAEVSKSRRNLVRRTDLAEDRARGSGVTESGTDEMLSPLSVRSRSREWRMLWSGGGCGRGKEDCNR